VFNCGQHEVAKRIAEIEAALPFAIRKYPKFCVGSDFARAR
jgi:hypothetical protein